MNSTSAGGATKKIHHFLLMSCSSFRVELVVNAQQPLAQMKHRIALARKQRVDVYATFCRQLLEAAPLQFVRDEHFALVVGQFGERVFQLVEKHAANVERLWPGIGRWQQFFDLQQFTLFIHARSVSEVLWPLLAKEVRDAVAR